MLKNDFIKNVLNSKYPNYLLGIVSFLEGIFFPIPVFFLLVPMCILKKEKAMLYALIGTITSVLGGVVGYLLGFFAYEIFIVNIIEYFNYQDSFSNFRNFYDKYGALAILLVGFTPIPFKIVAIASGVVGFNPLLFVAVSLFSRGVKFYAIAIIIKYFDYEKYLKLFFKDYMPKNKD